MDKPKILMQLDVDSHASSFDAVVAVDAGVDRLLQYHSVEPTEVRQLVHGAIFTRAPKDLRHTAVFVGGSNVAAGEVLLKQVTDSFFGPMRVSVLFDANGANTTASAAVLMAARHVDLSQSKAVVLGATGPVGQRAVRLLARSGAVTRVASRSQERAAAVCRHIHQLVPEAQLEPCSTSTAVETERAIAGSDILIAAGAAGIQLASRTVWSGQQAPRVAIDLNAVPPSGIEGIDAPAAGVDREGTACYGAVGVGGVKMKIHKAALSRLFTANDLVLDAEEVFRIGAELERA